MGAPKKLKYPKKPKTTASLAVWERYEARRKEIDKINSEKLKDYNKKQSLIKKLTR
jgi:hypothetical protein